MTPAEAIARRVDLLNRILRQSGGSDAYRAAVVAQRQGLLWTLGFDDGPDVLIARHLTEEQARELEASLECVVEL